MENVRTWQSWWELKTELAKLGAKLGHPITREWTPIVKYPDHWLESDTVEIDGVVYRIESEERYDRSNYWQVYRIAV